MVVKRSEFLKRFYCYLNLHFINLSICKQPECSFIYYSQKLYEINLTTNQ